MNYVYVLVEGETEEKFVKEILNPYFEVKDIFLHPVNLYGVSKYSIIKNQLQSLLKNKSFSLVTTMIDLYGCPTDMPKKSEINQNLNYFQKVTFLENIFKEDINDEKFLPYLQLHEFEALLFSDVSCFSLLSNNISEFVNIVQTKEPEEINDSPNTAPSKRIIQQIPQYEFTKPTSGIILAKKIGLEKMREKCSHFNNWIESIENICT
ncbi:DUF4276 family protein [bacterium]|nr:DUF4276 family protein [bacterium]MBU1882760.1 DUF4276 family protein [bacterium]